jgi:hypothetical protein
MNADQVIDLIKTLEPQEIERLFVLMKEYESDVRRRQADVRYATSEEFRIIADKVFEENKDLFQKLAKAEAAERSIS